MAATQEQFEAALDSAKVDEHDQTGQLRTRLRHHHETSPWELGTDITKWILDRYKEMSTRRIARSVSAAPTSSPREGSTDLPDENAIETKPPPVKSETPTTDTMKTHDQPKGVEPTVKAEAMDMSDRSAPSATPQHERSTMSATPQFQFDNRHQSGPMTGVDSGFADIKMDVKMELQDIDPLQLGSSMHTQSPQPSTSPYPVYASGMIIDKTEPEAEERDSSPFSPLSATVPSVDVKPQTIDKVNPQPQVNPQVVVTADTQDTDVPNAVVATTPDFPRTGSLGLNQDFVRAVSVSSTGSSIMRQSPTPVPMPTAPEREIILRESERLNFPSPPLSDHEFELPTRQPFDQSGGEVVIGQRNAVKTVRDQPPEMEWTRLLPAQQPTPPDSPTASSAGSDDMDMDMDMDSMDDGYTPEQNVDMQENQQRQSADASVNAIVASPVHGSNRSVNDFRGAQTKAKENDGSRSGRDKEVLPKKKKIASKEAGDKAKRKEQSSTEEPLKEWELRKFIAPREDELKELTSSNNGKDPIPFKDIRQLVPPVVTGADRGKLQASFDQLKRLLFPESGKAPVELYLNQLVWVVNQMAVAGSREYLSALAKSHNLRLLESILSHAYSKQKGSADLSEKKANITKWRSVKAAYFTVQLLRKLNPTDTLLISTKLDLRLREWYRRDKALQKAILEWKGKDWYEKGSSGSSTIASAASGASAQKRKASVNESANNKRIRAAVGDTRKGDSVTPSTASKSGPSANAREKGSDADAISAFLAPAASARPTRPTPAKKANAGYDPLAQAFAAIRSAQTVVPEPEPVRRSPDPSRPPRIGRNGQPRPHMTVRWKDGDDFVKIKMIEARDSTEHHDGGARELELAEGAAFRKQLMWHPPLEMAYRGTPDVGVVEPAERIEQISRQLSVPVAVYEDESEIPANPDESNVQIATVDENNVTAIPLWKEDAQAYLPTHQFMQQIQGEGQTGAIPSHVSNPSTPTPAPATPIANSTNFAWASMQPPAPPSAPGNNPPRPQLSMLPNGLNFNVSALAQSISGLVGNPGFNNSFGFSNQPAFNNQPGYNAQPGFNAQSGYNSQLGYNGQFGYNPQPGYSQPAYSPPSANFQIPYNQERGYNAAPGYSPPNNGQRPGGPPMHPDRRNAADREGMYRRRGA